jgi:hypothetical protein
MSGPIKTAKNGAYNSTSYTNSILGYLLGFAPKLDVETQRNPGWDKFTDKKKPKVNSRDAKLHFLMGRYNSN